MPKPASFGNRVPPYSLYDIYRTRRPYPIVRLTVRNLYFMIDLNILTGGGRARLSFDAAWIECRVGPGRGRSSRGGAAPRARHDPGIAERNPRNPARSRSARRGCAAAGRGRRLSPEHPGGGRAWCGVGRCGREPRSGSGAASRPAAPPQRSCFRGIGGCRRHRPWRRGPGSGGRAEPSRSRRQRLREGTSARRQQI